MNINLKIGDTITVEDGIEIANQLGLTYISNRLNDHPERYEDFIFDGCSCLPDEMLGFFTGCKWEDITYKCCLEHDIQYAYGDLNNDCEKKIADRLFEENLIKKAGMNSWMAKVFLAAVKIGGAEEFGLSFSWGFANRQEV